MIKIRSEIKIDKFPFEINRESGLFLIGSCFSQNISNRLQMLKYDYMVNPFGISYNPHSIHQLLIRENAFSADEFIESEELFFHYDLHSDLSGPDLKILVANCNRQLELQIEYLSRCSCLFISYGTSYVYKHKESMAIVNNCHKQPASQFSKWRLNPKEIIADWKSCHDRLKKQYPNIKNIVFTLSPVRHLKDGVTNNQVSKSILRLAIEEIASTDKNLHYFPSYEIMMDDLRDYRYYENDLIHPSRLAIEYIWEKFSKAFVSENSSKIDQEIQKLNQAFNHKAFHPSSKKHQAFVQDLILKMERIQEKNAIDFNLEIKELKSQLIS